MEKVDKTRDFNFWNDHSLEFLEMAMKRDFQETVQSSDGYGKHVRDGCNDTIEFFVMENKGIFDSISYDLSGCVFSHACANTLIHLIKGRRIEDAQNLTAQDIINFLKTLPKNEWHCADHALAAFKLAVDDLKQQKK